MYEVHRHRASASKKSRISATAESPYCRLSQAWPDLIPICWLTAIARFSPASVLKFNDFIQAIHRVQRFGQTKAVIICIIYMDVERDLLKTLLEE